MAHVLTSSPPWFEVTLFGLQDYPGGPYGLLSISGLPKEGLRWIQGPGSLA